MSEASELVHLVHHRWAIPVLAALYDTQGMTSAAIIEETGGNPGAVRRALRALEAIHLVELSHAVGYVLTDSGNRAARPSWRIWGWVFSRVLGDVLLRKWSLPVLYAVDPEKRFSEVRTLLPGITDRALTLALDDLQNEGLIERRMLPARPPAVLYRVHPRARGLVELIGDLCASL